MTKPEAFEVIVVGAGPAGLALALGLARRGHQVTVLEAATQPPPDRRGLILWPAASRVLRALGVGAEVRRRGRVLKALTFTGSSRDDRLRVAAGDWGAVGEFWGVLPSVLSGILERHCVEVGVDVRRGYRLQSVPRASGPRSRELRVEGPEGGQTLHCRLLVGADGPNSLVRREMGFRLRSFRYPGQGIYSGLGGATRVDELRHALEDGYTVAVAPMSDSCSWVALTSHGDDGGPWRQRCAERDPEVRQALASLTLGRRLQPVSGRVEAWEANRLVLLGDAVHPFLPHLGFGVSQALEDVSALLHLLPEALERDQLDVETLAEFRGMRRARVDAMQWIANVWASTATGHVWLGRRAREWTLAKLQEREAQLIEMVTELAGGGCPDWTHSLRLLNAGNQSELGNGDLQRAHN